MEQKSIVLCQLPIIPSIFFLKESLINGLSPSLAFFSQVQTMAETKNLLNKENRSALRDKFVQLGGSRFFRNWTIEWKCRILSLGFKIFTQIKKLWRFKVFQLGVIGGELANLTKFTNCWNFQGFRKAIATSFPRVLKIPATTFEIFMWICDVSKT